MLSDLSPFARMDVPTLLTRAARRQGNDTFLIWAPEEGKPRHFTYGEFLYAVRCIASGLQARGVSRGDRVLVHLENSPETLLARFACAWLGAVCVTTNAMATGPELRVFNEVADARFAITQPGFVKHLSDHVRGLEWIIVTNQDGGREPETLPAFSDSFASLYASPMEQRPPEPDLPALILFTSGTTGRPKAVVWTHENMAWAAMLGAMQQRIVRNDVVQIFLPLFHVVGFSWGVLSAIGAGAAVLLQPKFSASRFWNLAVSHRATVAAHVPFTIAAIRDLERPKTHFFRQWITNKQMSVEQARHEVPLFSSAWGMTEMVSQPIVGDQTIGALEDGALGRPSVGYSIRIAGPEGRLVAPGESGELLVRGVRGRSIFKEYFGDARATAEAFDEDGYFRTGDRVRLEPDGSITFIDRIKDVIKIGGEGVAAGEIEAAIMEVSGVSQVAVVAGPDELRGEIPVAFVVVSEDIRQTTTQTQAAIESHCAAVLSRFKQPKKIIFVEDLPKVGFGKVSKARLREMARDALRAECERQ
jgi:crotonobetaine/carnitine-CoA ligase